MISLFMALALIAQAPHFSEDPDAVATPGASQTAAAPAPPAARAAPVTVVADPRVKMLAEENHEDPISCQTLETTGTRFTSRRCLRKSQWDELARQGRETYDSWSAGAAITH